MSEPTVQELNPQQEQAPAAEADHDRHPQRTAGMTADQARAEIARIEARIASMSVTPTPQDAAQKP